MLAIFAVEQSRDLARALEMQAQALVDLAALINERFKFHEREIVRLEAEIAQLKAAPRRSGSDDEALVQ